MAWVIVLLGAVIAAYLPSLLAGVSRRALVPGWRFQLALEVLQALEQQRCAPGHGLTVMQLAARLHVDPLQLEPVAEMLVQLDWVGKLAEEGAGQAPRLVLLAEPYTTLLGPLVQALLLPREASTEPLWHNGKLASLTLRDALSNQ